jgi:phosphatidylserine decarboxylase
MGGAKVKEVLKNHTLPVQIEGFPYIVAGVILVLASALMWRGIALEAEAVHTSPSTFAVIVSAALTVFFSLFTLFSIWFFRNPDREIPQGDPLAVLSPADGRVLKIEEIDGKVIGEARALKISIFMSPMDVHVNRVPVNGKVEKIDYVMGKFFKADLDKASEQNEHNVVVMKSDAGPRVAFNQIAGFIARRIVCYVDTGINLARGERYGMIRFGSRMEVTVPVSSVVKVKPNDRTVAGVTTLAQFKL